MEKLERNQEKMKGNDWFGNGKKLVHAAAGLAIIGAALSIFKK